MTLLSCIVRQVVVLCHPRLLQAALEAKQYFKWANGKELEAKRVLRIVIKSLVPQDTYEARICSMTRCHKKILKVSISDMRHAGHTTQWKNICVRRWKRGQRLKLRPMQEGEWVTKRPFGEHVVTEISSIL